MKLLKKIADKMSEKYFGYIPLAGDSSEAPKKEDGYDTMPAGRDFEAHAWLQSYYDRNKINHLEYFHITHGYKGNLNIIKNLLEFIKKILIVLEDAPDEIVFHPKKFGIDQRLKSLLTNLMSSFFEFLINYPNLLDKTLPLAYKLTYSINDEINKLFSVINLPDYNPEGIKFILKPLRINISSYQGLIDAILSGDTMKSSPYESFRSYRTPKDVLSEREPNEIVESYESKDEKRMINILNLIMNETFHKNVDPKTYRFLSKENVDKLLKSLEEDDDFYMHPGDPSGLSILNIILQKISSLGNKLNFQVLTELNEESLDKYLDSMWIKKEISDKDKERAKLLAKIYRELEFVNIKKMNMLQRKEIFLKLSGT